MCDFEASHVLVQSTHRLLDKKRIYKASAFEPTEGELEDIQRSIRKSSSWADDDESSPEPPSALYKGKGKGKAKAEPVDDLDIGDLDLDDEPVEPSTKMLKMVRSFMRILSV